MFRNFLIASIFITLLSVLSEGFIVSGKLAGKVLERTEELLREGGR